MGKEKITDEALAAAVRKAEILPRVSATERQPDEMEGPVLFGNNFYMLFLAMKKVRTNPEHTLINTYLRKAESLGKPWQDFCAQNISLLTEIDNALGDFEIHQKLRGLHRDLCVAMDERVDKFNAAFDSELGIDAIAFPIYRKLNPLLQAAADALRKLGIDPFKLELIEGAK